MRYERVLLIDMPTPGVDSIDPMQILWHNQFDQLFRNFYPCLWRLLPRPFGDPNCDWISFSDSAKVRFLCECCGHGWTSMKGRVVFWYYLNPGTLQGVVLFALFGQQCLQCSKDDRQQYTAAMWYAEEVVKVLHNVYNRVGQSYYGFQQPPFVRMCRPGRPRSQHPTQLCQACQLGVCASSSGSQSRSSSSTQESIAPKINSDHTIIGDRIG